MNRPGCNWGCLLFIAAAIAIDAAAIYAIRALALGLIGFSIGAALIAGISDYFPRRVILEIDNVLALGFVVVVVCLTASGLGVRAALRIDPATALGS